MAKVCITRADHLPETLRVDPDLMDLLSVSRPTGYNRLKESGVPYFQGGENERIGINKNAFLHFVGWQPIELTEELAETPLIWKVDDVAAYQKCCRDTAHALMKKTGAPVWRFGRQYYTCREAWLIFTGYKPPIKAVTKDLMKGLSPITRALLNSFEQATA